MKKEKISKLDWLKLFNSGAYLVIAMLIVMLSGTGTLFLAYVSGHTPINALFLSYLMGGLIGIVFYVFALNFFWGNNDKSK